LLRCHAGCDQQSVISALRVRGLWTDAPSRLRDACRTHVERKPVTGETERTAAALAIWNSSTWARGTPVER
jgi:putative DNA primase/helicase